MPRAWSAFDRLGPVGGTTRQAAGATGLQTLQTILVVGTSDVRRARHVDLLKQAGHVVDELAQPDAVLPYLERVRPPLVVIDCERGDAAALEVCRRIKGGERDTFVLQISPTHDGKGPDPGQPDAAVDAFLVDPIDAREMLALVRSFLRLQAAEADLRISEDRLQLAQESAGLAILDWTIASNSFVHSPNFIELFDLGARDQTAPMSAQELIDRIHPDDLPGLIEEFSEDSRTSGSFDREYRIKRSDGSVRWIASRGRFFTDAAGAPERMLSLSFDVTQRKTAEHANAVLAAVVASSNDAIISIDGSGSVTSWNAGAENLFGLSTTQMIGRPLAVALSDTSEAEREHFRQQIMDGAAHELETRQKRRDGAPIDIWVSSAPIRGAGGRIVGASLIVRDVSAQKQREDHIRFLMRELTHRSKNLLAVIQAMARQSLAKDITPEEFVRRFSDRLAGLAGSHDLLSSVQWKGVSLMGLINSQLNHYEELFGTRIVLDGTDITIRPEAAQNVGIALHELSTNAAKYGALSNDDGRVTIAWSISSAEPRMLSLRWQESGGPPVATPTRKGFGTTVMDRIAGRALDGRSAVRFEPDGVVWSLDVPATSAIVT